MLRVAFAAVIALALSLAISTSAHAGIVIDLGGGWEAEIDDPDHVDLVVDFVGRDRLVIEKFAKFLSFDPVQIIFRQNRPDAETVDRIIITDEFLANNTGQNWPAFFMSVSAAATFNQGASASFSIDPFTNRAYSGGSRNVLFSGGVVVAGDVWTPGVESGGLVIDIDLSGQEPVVFRLVEMPIPAPGALALLAVAALVARRRRR